MKEKAEISKALSDLHDASKGMSPGTYRPNSHNDPPFEGEGRAADMVRYIRNAFPACWSPCSSRSSQKVTAQFDHLLHGCTPEHFPLPGLAAYPNATRGTNGNRPCNLTRKKKIFNRHTSFHPASSSPANTAFTADCKLNRSVGEKNNSMKGCV